MVGSYKTGRFLKQQVSIELKIFNILFVEGKSNLYAIDRRLEVKNEIYFIRVCSNVPKGLDTSENQSYFRKIKFHNVLHLPVWLHSNLDEIACGKISSL